MSLKILLPNSLLISPILCLPSMSLNRGCMHAAILYTYKYKLSYNLFHYHKGVVVVEKARSHIQFFSNFRLPALTGLSLLTGS